MTTDQLSQALAGLGKGQANVNGVIASTSYACPTRTWLTASFAPALKADLDRLGASTYILSKNDCTDFSLYAMALARLSHNLTTDAQTALAFGTMDYIKVDTTTFQFGGHRINLVVVEENGVYVPVFFEPQLPGIVTLSQEEMDSIRAYYI